MILGLSVPAFVTIHVVLSLLGIVLGLVALVEMIQGKLSSFVTAGFLTATVLTSVTGFPIPPPGLDPPRIVGVVSLALLAVAVSALYGFRLAGRWRWIYVAAAVAALYLNCFVAVVQAFSKVAFLNALAPTQQEPPFAVAQIVVLVVFVVSGVVAGKKFRPQLRPAR
jgi:uncharacterized membrane protein